MQLNKIKVTEKADNQLRQLKSKTGLTPNLLCRIGFCLSLNEAAIPNPEDYPEDGKEFNRYTLTGQWDGIFMALLRQRLHNDGLDLEENFEPQFRAHLNRGVFRLFQRSKSLADIARLVEEAAV